MKPHKSDAAVIEALERTGGNVTLSAQILNLNSRSLRERIAGNPELQKVRDEQRDSLLDIAERNIRKSILNENIDDSWKILRTLGRKRGYVEKEEIEQTGGVTVVIRNRDNDL